MAYDGIISIGIVPDDSQLTRTLRHLSTHTSRTINQAINAHTQPLGRITGEANEFQKSLAASNARVIAFGASTGILFALKAAFQQLVSSTIEVEKQMTEVNSVFRLSSQQLKSFSNELFALASNYGLSFGDASKAAVEFARQGNSVTETLNRTAAALALARISGLGMEESVNSLTSILNTFQKEGLEAMDVINRLTAVDQNFAISAGAMADALSRVSSSASDANVSLNETLGLIAAAKQITGRTGSVIGNSFKTMFTRLQRPEVLDDLESVGVKARDAEGRLRPMLDILRALASSYDGLASSQKSFVAETVGGVYQINILKAIMRDLGSGMSIVDGAMKTAGESTDFVNQRMEVLNETISSQLIRTANNLKLAFYNVGASLVAGPLRSGLGNFDSLVRGIGKYSDPNTAKEGSTTDKLKANVFQGALKGVANFAAGPGLQFLMTTLLKLFENLDTFIVQSAKDLAGINTQEKQRKAINQGISEWLGTQRNLLSDILTDQVSINQAMEMYLADMKGAVAAANSLKAVTESIGIRAITQVSFAGGGAKRAAGGYIPNLEIAEARRGGYQAGRVLNTTISNGSERLNVIANGAESMTTVMQDGKSYDFINPPKGSPAANLHRAESLRQTGIDPYQLPKMEMKAKGFVPNLALTPELVQTITNLGVDPKTVLSKARLTNPENFTNLPQGMTEMFVSRYRHDPASLEAALSALVKKGDNLPLSNGPAMAKFLSGFMLNPLAQNKGLFSDMSPAAVASLTEAFTGKEAQSPQAALAKIAKLTNLRPEDVQRVLNLHSKSIPFIAGYESPNDLSDARDRPNQTSSIEFPINPDKGEMKTFSIATPIYGFKGNMAAHFEKIEALMRAEAETDEQFTPGEIGTTRGVFFDKKLRAMAKKEGVPVGDVGSSLDIHGPVRSILSKTNIKSAVSAMELKASAYGAMDSGNMAEKVFRTLAGEPGTGGRKPALKGPVGYVPKLVNIQPFNAKAGGIGIIDADRYGQEGVTDAAFSALVYAAVGSGKPLRIHYGPMTMGKTTAAEHIVSKAGGIGAAGGDYVTDIKEIDSDKFKQFIINKTDRKQIDTGVFGLALASASQVRAFYSPYTEYKAKHEQMIKRLRERNRGQEGKNAEAIAKKYDEPAWQEYSDNINHLQKKLGHDRVSLYDQENPMAAGGFIPNLSTESDLSKELSGRITMAKKFRGFEPENFNINMLPPIPVKRQTRETNEGYEKRILKDNGFIRSSSFLAYGPTSSVDGYKIRPDAIDLAEVKSDDSSGLQNWTLANVKDKFLRGIAENYKTGSGNQLTKALHRTRNVFGHLFAPPLVLKRKSENQLWPDGPAVAGHGFVPNLSTYDLAARRRYQQMEYEGGSSEHEDTGPVKIAGSPGTFLNYEGNDGVLSVEKIARATGERNPLLAFKKLMKEYEINKIDAGSVVGPRVPKIISGFLNHARNTENQKDMDRYAGMKISGQMIPASLVREAAAEVRSKELTTRGFKQMVAAMRDLGVKDFRSNKAFNFNETVADGFIPNLAVDYDKLSAIESYSGRMKYLASEGKLLGKGSSRAVYDIGDGKVIKLAINDKGVAQNFGESNAADNENPILTKLYESDAMGRYLVSEKAEKMTAGAFKKMTGQKFSTYSGEMRWSDTMRHRGGVKTTSKFAEDVKRFGQRNDSPLGDLARRANLGVVKRKDPEDLFGYERDQPALIDYGLTQDIFQEHYIRGGRFSKGFIPNLSMDDAYRKVVRTSQDGILKREIADRARMFVNTTSATKNKGNSVDREYLVASLYNRAIGKPVGRDMEIMEKVLGINESMFDVLFDGFSSQVNLPELRKRVSIGDFGNAAKGFIPNLYDAAADALDRENSATGGKAVLSSHPMLRTTQNPMGLAAIDSRTQSDAGDAARQHMKLGQSLSDVRVAHTANGHIPNLAVSSVYDEPFNASQSGTFSSMSMLNSLILSLAGAAKQEIRGPERMLDRQVAKDGWLSSFASDGARAAAKLRILEEEFGKASESLIQERNVTLSPLAGGRTIGGREPNKLKLLESEAKNAFVDIRPAAEKYQKALDIATASASKIGRRTAVGASIGGGIASQFAGSINPSLGTAVDEFSNGATQAGQILLTFPNKFGWAGALAVAGGAAVSAIDIFRRGMANAARNFELSHARIDQLNSQLDSLAVSVNQYDSIVLDASVSLQAIEATQRQYRETLAQLRSTEEGSKEADKIASAPDSKTRINSILEQKQKNVREDNLAQSILSVKKYADPRSFLGAQKIFGVKQLGFSNLTEQRQVEGVVRGNAGAIISDLSDGLKDLLSNVKDGAELTAILNDATKNSDTDISSSAKDIVEAFRSLAEKLDETSLGQVKSNVVTQLQSEANDNTPDRQNALAGLKFRNAERQTQTESALNYARLQQRLFVNSGALNSSNKLNLRDVNTQNAQNEAQVFGSNSVARRQANVGEFRLKYGERTVKEYETATEINRIGSDRDTKVSQVQTETLRTALGTLTQNFDQKINNAEQYRNAGKPGGATPTIGTYDVKFLTALNKGISKTAEEGFANLKGESGAIDIDKLISSISKNSGAEGSSQEGILNYLKANVGNVEILRAQLDANKQIVALNQEANVEAQKQTVALEGFYREANFKELAGYMGGIKSLLDRGSRRNLQRNLVRGAFLMERGRTPEAKATGAALYLESLKSMGTPLDPNKNTSLSKSIKQAYATLVPNLALLQQQVATRVGNSSLLKNTVSGAGLREYANRSFSGKAAAAATLSEYPMESNKISRDSTVDIAETSALFRNELKDSTSALTRFVLSVDELQKKMATAEIAAVAVRTKNSGDARKDAGDTLGDNSGSPSTPRGPTTGGVDTGKLQRYGVAAGAPTVDIGAGLIGSAVVGTLIKRAWNKRRAAKAIAEAQAQAPAEPAVTEPTPSRSKNAQKASVKPNPASTLKLGTRLSVNAGTLSEAVPTPSSESQAGALKAQQAQAERNRLNDARRINFKPNIITKDTLAFRSARGQNLPATDFERKLDERNYAKSQEVNEKGQATAAAKAARSKIASFRERLSFTQEKLPAFSSEGFTKPSTFSRGGVGKAAITAGIIALASSAILSKVQAAQSEQTAQNEDKSGKFDLSKALINKTDVAKTGVNAGTHAYFLKSSDISKLTALKKGAALAGVGLVGEKLEDVIGGKAGKVAGSAVNIGGAAKFFGTKGGIGAAVGIGSEALRSNFTEKKFGYGAGVSQGFAGAVGGGAAFGPVGSAISAGLYLGGEAAQVNAETKGNLSDRKGLDAYSIFQDAKDLNGTTEGNAGAQIQKLLSRLTGRSNELQNRKETDANDFSGLFGNIMRAFSPRQFGKPESKQLSQVTNQQNRLANALNSGDTKEMLKVLQDIQAELVKQSREVSSGTSSATSTSNAGNNNSQINVDISVKDLDKIPSEINDSVIQPLVDQLAQLQLKVNELVNQRTPRPAAIG